MRDTERPTYMQKLRGWLRKRGSVEGEGCRKDSKIVIERGHKDRQSQSQPTGQPGQLGRDELLSLAVQEEDYLPGSQVASIRCLWAWSSEGPFCH